jgi:hypothetical protein
VHTLSYVFKNVQRDIRVYVCVCVYPQYILIPSIHYQHKLCQRWGNPMLFLEKRLGFHTDCSENTLDCYHSCFRAFQSCWVPKLPPIQSSFSKNKWVFLRHKERYYQHHYWCCSFCVCPTWKKKINLGFSKQAVQLHFLKDVLLTSRGIWVITLINNDSFHF